MRAIARFALVLALAGAGAGNNASASELSSKRDMKSGDDKFQELMEFDIDAELIKEIAMLDTVSR